MRAAWEAAYDDEPFVHLLPEGQWPRTADVLGTNTVHLQVALDERGGRVIVVAAMDNLTKGTAVAACSAPTWPWGCPRPPDCRPQESPREHHRSPPGSAPLA